MERVDDPKKVRFILEELQHFRIVEYSAPPHGVKPS
jgi:hypothetical protein